MRNVVRQSAALLGALAMTLILGGCAAYGVEDIFRDQRYPDTQRYRIDRDVQRYVDTIDRRLRMETRQERNIEQMLRDRTYRLMDRTRRGEERYVYPFPRRDYREMTREQREFWNHADGQIERRLSRAQAREYAYMTGRGDRYADRYERRDRRYDNRRYEDRRYEDRRYEDRRYDDDDDDDDDDDGDRGYGRDDDDDDD